MTDRSRTGPPVPVGPRHPDRPSPHTPVAGHGHSVPLGRVARIPIRLHWSFFLLPLLVVVVDWRAGGRAVVEGLVWLVALFASVVVHEIAHCLVARRRGAVVLGIVLFPLGGLSSVESIPDGPDNELVIAAAGPLTSLALGAVFVLFGLATSGHVWPPTLFVGSWLARLGWLNLLLGAFNLLPALPMDGGRMLRAFLARHRTNLEATVVAARVARVLGALMMAVGLFYDFWFLLIGLFVLLGANAEEQAARHAPARAPGRPDTREPQSLG